MIARPGRRLAGLRVDGPELAAIAALAAAVVLWQAPTRGWGAIDALPFALGLGYLSILAGRLIVDALRLPPERFGEVPTIFLIGFLFLNALLLAAALASPRSLRDDALILAAGVVACALAAGAPRGRPSESGRWAGPGCLTLSLVAATLWSLDSIAPTVAEHGAIVFKPWADSYFHACMIRVLRDAHGMGTLGHFAMAGEPAPPYHYGSYMPAALLAATTDATCYLAFVAFLNPLGVALTGLAAYTLARWWWGPGAGFAAAVGVLLVPDASRYGIANPYLGYHWLIQTGPALAFGAAMMAVAWVLVFEGCREARPGVVAAGFLAAGLSVAFKAHLFVANALLIWAYPAFLFRGAARRYRLAWLGFSLATFAAAVGLSQRVPGVPRLRLDGSAFTPYMNQLAGYLDDGPLRRLLTVGAGGSKARDLLAATAHLAFGTFGALAAALPILALARLLGFGGDDGGADRRARAESIAFPFLVAINYLIMAMGLALDDRLRGTPEELLHRPLVWAYLAVASWTFGCFYEIVLRSPLGRSGAARVLAGIVLMALLAVPYACGPAAQVGPGWGRMFTSMRVPPGLVNCARFLREHAAPGEVVQNSEGDRWMVLSALAERPTYVADVWEGKTNPRLTRRLAEMDEFRRLTDARQIIAFAARRKIAWYVLDPATPSDWPAEIIVHPAYRSRGFLVYHFPY